MGKTYEEIVSNYDKPDPEWQVTINGTDYTRNVNLMEFENSINNPVKFTVKTSGISGRETDISQGQEVVFKYSGFELFRGVLQQVDAGTGLTATLKGAGYASELDSDVSKNYSGTNVTNIVNDLIDSTSVINNRTFSTSFNLSSTLTVDDFRVNKTQLQDVNRLMGEYDTEWYTSYDSNNNPVFNVTDQIQNDDNGNALDTIKTSGPGQTAEVVKRNTNRNKGDYDGVIVRGYGDGDDQVTATAGSTGKGNRVLIYTDKTILSSSQAQKRADNLNNTRTVTWREIRVKPAEPGKLYGLGDLLKVDAEDAKLDDNYRVVETYYKIDLDQNDVSSKLTLSNKAQTFISEFKTEKEKREGQTDHMQGNRNTINESNTEIADSTNSTKVELDIPKRFVEDVAGKDRTKKVYLDYAVKDYKKAFQASNIETIDKNTKLVDTTVSNFGDVEQANTSNQSLDQGAFSTPAAETGEFINENMIIINAGSSWTNPALTQVATAGPNGTLGGINIHWSVNNQSGSDTTFDWAVKNTTAGTTLDSGTSTVGNNSTIVYNANVVGVNEGDNVTLDIDSATISTASGEDFFSYVNLELASSSEHDHDVGSQSGNVSGKVFVEKDGGGNLDASVNSNQNNESLPNTNTTTFGKLDSNDIVLQSQSTSASQLTVKVNGTEISGSPFSLSGSKPYTKNDIDITSYINSPGFNTIELIPDAKALVKGNAIVDHKLDSERS